MHELGHAVGLGHAQHPAEIMYPVLTRKPARWGAGDLAGLRVLGSGPCVRGA
jgi:predicted Zn-dependent protease